MAASSSRPLIVGADAGPESPFPVRMEGPVIAGFGRGSKELGIPTANLPVDEKTTPWIAGCESGVYFGWAQLGEVPADKDPSGTSSVAGLYPMVMSIGFNPFYGNTTRTAEVHILHKFDRDFYGAPLCIAILGYVRPERGDYASVDALVADIRFDCDVARRSLARPAWTPAGVKVAEAGAGAGAEAGAGAAAEAEGTLDLPWLVANGKAA